MFTRNVFVNVFYQKASDRYLDLDLTLELTLLGLLSTILIGALANLH